MTKKVKTLAQRFEELDLVSAAEIARRCDVHPNTVFQWQRRHEDFPQPHVVIEERPYYLWAEVQEYRTKREARKVS